MNTQVVYVIVESASAARLVLRTIPDPAVEVYNAEERSAAMMMACGALSRERVPTVLLRDSETLEDRTLLEEQLEVGGYLNRCRASVPCRLVLAIPQVEAILFSDREGFEKALGRRVPDLDWFEARFRPRAVLRRLLGDDDFAEKALTFIKSLDDAAVRRMAQHEIVQEIREFIDEVQEAKSRRARVRRAG
jgi:hypothetical protein